FLTRATRYYQMYDLGTGKLLDQSRELQLLGLQFSSDELRQIVEGPVVMDMQTDQGQLRFYNDRVASPAGRAYLLQVGISLETERLALDRFIRLALRSEEHTSELQSRFDLVCRLLLEKKKQ